MFDEERTYDKVEPNRDNFRVFRPARYPTSKGIEMLQTGDFLPKADDIALYELWQADQIRLTSEFPEGVKYKEHRKTHHKPKTAPKAKPKPKS